MHKNLKNIVYSMTRMAAGNIFLLLSVIIPAGCLNSCEQTRAEAGHSAALRTGHSAALRTGHSAGLHSGMNPGQTPVSGLARIESIPSEVKVAPVKDLFPDKVRVTYARNFSIEYHGNYKVVNLLNFSGKKADTLQYLLVQRGTTGPPGYPKAQRIQIPVRSIIALSSLHIGLAEFNGSADLIVGLGNFQFVNSAIVRKRIQEKKVKEVGLDGSLNNETIIAIHPDLVMADANPDSKFSRYETLQQAGIPVMINAEWLENTPLARTEWVKLLAAFLNKEKAVNTRFKLVEDRYLSLVRLGKKAVSRPTAIIGMPYKGTWFTPAGSSYMAVFLRDAAIGYNWNKTPGSGSLSFNFETVAPVALKADYWLNVGYVNSKKDILAIDSRYADFNSFKTGKLYNNNKKVNELGSNDYWESGAVSPDVVLADLLRIVHPELLPAHELVYFKQLH